MKNQIEIAEQNKATAARWRRKPTAQPAGAISYLQLEEALEDGCRVETCSINQHCEAVNWSPVDKVSQAFDLSRYRYFPN